MYVAFLSAVEEGDEEAVSSYVQLHPEVWKKTTDTVCSTNSSNTPRRGPNEFDTFSIQLGNTCLHLARDARMAQYLIVAGADIEASNEVAWFLCRNPLQILLYYFKVGNTPFLQSVLFRRIGVMKSLVSKGCNIRAKTSVWEISRRLVN